MPSSAGTTYTVRGLAPGSYMVNVELDTQGTGVRNSSNPAGNSVIETITSSNLTAVNVAISDRTPVAPAAPSAPNVFPSDSTALVTYDEVDDSDGEELATSYQLSYGTDTSASNFGTLSSKAGNTLDFFVANLGHVNGTALYFKLAAVNGSGTSGYSPVFGPITINPASGSNTVSGTVNFSGTAPRLNVVLFSETSGVYFVSYANPSSRTFSIAGVPNGTYSLFAFLDEENCGYVCVGNPNNFYRGPGGLQQINVNGDSPGNAISISGFSAAFFVTTNHTTGNGGPDSYGVRISVRAGTALPLLMTLVSASYVAVPFDMNAEPQKEAYSPIFC